MTLEDKGNQNKRDYEIDNYILDLVCKMDKVDFNKNYIINHLQNFVENEIDKDEKMKMDYKD